MAYIGKQPIVGNFQICDAISVVNGQAAYTMQVASTNVNPESANHMLVSLNGVLQKPGSSFTISGSTITFASNLVTNDVIDFIILLGDVLNIGTPSDDAVKTASLQANAVTAAKFNADVISGQTALAATPADTDEFLISDAGVLKRLDYSYIKASSGLVHIKTLTASNSSSLDFSNGSSNVVLDSTYSRYVFYIDIQLASDNVQLQFLYSDDAGSSYLDANYAYGMIGRNAGGSTVTRNNSNDSQIELFPETIGQDTDETFALTLNLSQPAQTDTHKTCFWNGGGFNTSATLFGYTGAAMNYSDVSAVTGVRFKASSGNIERGTISMFGVAKS